MVHEGESVPIFKATMIFTQTTVPDPSSPAAPRVSGWSESWYRNAGASQSVLDLLNVPGGLCSARSRLLGESGAINAQRIQAVDPIGPAEYFSKVFKGNAGVSDIPQMSLSYAVTAQTTGQKRKLDLRGIPDARIIGGAYSKSKDYDNFVDLYDSQLSGWGWYAKDNTFTKYNVVSVTAGGLVSLKVATPFVINDKVAFTRTKDDVSGVTRPYQTSVLSLGPAANQFQLASWPYAAANGGKVAKFAIVFVVYDAKGFGLRAATRKVGRPFDLYRGRVPTRTR